MAESANTWPPSPTPPYSRPVQSPLTQTLTAAGAVSLTQDTTYLETTEAGPTVITIADGNYTRQFKRVYIPTDMIATTGEWTLTGTFAGFTSLTFDATNQSAVLEWDGSGWQMVGGNATQNA